MRWLAIQLPFAFRWPKLRFARAAAFFLCAVFLSTPSLAGDTWTLHTDSVEISYALLIGSCSGPAAYSYVDDRVTERRLGLFGAQIELRQGHFGQVAVGIDLMIGPRSRTVGDSSFYDEPEHIRYSAIFLYVSPGLRARIGKDQPLSLGASVDLGPLWARESNSYSWRRSGEGYLSVERILAIRPRLQISYNLTHTLQVQFEYGWLLGKIRPAYYPDYASNWYVEFPRDFDGPFFNTSISFTRPVARKTITVVK